jgi:hypothetical protein
MYFPFHTIQQGAISTCVPSASWQTVRSFCVQSCSGKMREYLTRHIYDGTARNFLLASERYINSHSCTRASTTSKGVIPYVVADFVQALFVFQSSVVQEFRPIRTVETVYRVVGKIPCKTNVDNWACTKTTKRPFPVF